MNDFGGFTEDDFCLVFLVFGGMGIVVSGILFLIQDHLARRDQRARIETLLKPTLMAAPKHRPYPVRSLKNHTTIPGGGEPAMTDRTKMTPKRVSPQNSLYDLVRLQIRHLFFRCYDKASVLIEVMPTYSPRCSALPYRQRLRRLPWWSYRHDQATSGPEKRD